MSFRNYISKKIVLPTSDLILGHSILKHFKFLQRSQNWSRRELEDFQNEKLASLIRHSYHNVQYYRELFDSRGLRPADIKTKKDLIKLPIIKKETIRENIRNGKLIATNLKKKDMILNSSSGSTGKPLQYFLTKQSYSFNIAANLRGWYNMGYKLGDKYLKLSFNPRKKIKKKVQDYLNNCLYFQSEGISEDSKKDIVYFILNNRPKFIRGYPATLSLIGNYINSNQINIPDVNAINTTGDILFPEMRRIIERAFDCPVFDSYSGEGVANMFEVSKDKYLVSHEYAITELLDNNGKIISEGEGELITTDLWNYANPFIRYAVEDIVVASDKNPEKFGWEVNQIKGRLVDILELSNGNILIVHFFTGFFEWEKSVDQFQVVQKAPDKIEVRLIVNAFYNQEEEEKITKRIRDHIGEGIELRIQLVDKIPITRAGKRRFMLKSF